MPSSGSGRRQPAAFRAAILSAALPDRLDAVVNNASLFEHDDAGSFSHERFSRHLLANTAAPVLLAQALAEHLATRGAGPASGCVVNLLDQKLFNPNPDFLSYTLSKAALQSATTLLAQALAPRVRVVGVAPGLTLTSHLLSDERFAELHQQSPLGRSSTPDDVAAAVVFALGNASVTGATLLVDGGQHAAAVFIPYWDIRDQVALRDLLGDAGGVRRFAAQLASHLTGNKPGHQTADRHRDDSQRQHGLPGVIRQLFRTVRQVGGGVAPAKLAEHLRGL